MASDVRYEVRGLRELKAAFRKVEGDLKTELKEGFKAIAEDVAGAIRPKVPKRTGRAAGSVKARGSLRGGAIAFGGSAAPYYPWLDFGGRVGINKRIARDFLTEGRYVYPTIREKRDDIIEHTDDLIGHLARKAGFETTGDN